MKIQMYDVKEWIQSIKDHGLKRFTFTDLKSFGLDNRLYVRKARMAGLLRKAGNERQKCGGDPIAIWEIP